MEKNLSAQEKAKLFAQDWAKLLRELTKPEDITSPEDLFKKIERWLKEFQEACYKNRWEFIPKSLFEVLRKF